MANCMSSYRMDVHPKLAKQAHLLTFSTCKPCAKRSKLISFEFGILNLKTFATYHNIYFSEYYLFSCRHIQVLYAFSAFVRMCLSHTKSKTFNTSINSLIIPVLQLVDQSIRRILCFKLINGRICKTIDGKIVPLTRKTC